jgi:hypothetical protein
LILLRGKKRSSEREKGVSCGAERAVVVEPSPGSTFEVVEADLLLHLLVIPLDAPAELCEADQGA